MYLVWFHHAILLENLAKILIWHYKLPKIIIKFHIEWVWFTQSTVYIYIYIYIYAHNRDVFFND